MKKRLFLSFISAALSTLMFIGCADDTIVEPEPDPVQTNTARNIDARTNKVYYRFSDSSVVTGGDTATAKWDIAIMSTSIYTNSGSSGTGAGGAKILDGDFASLKTTTTDGFNIDAVGSLAIPTGSGNGWYTYAGPPSHLITPLPGKIFVIRGGDGKYTKVRIISYYQDAPTNPTGSETGRIYTFEFVHQPSGSPNFE